MVTQMLFKSSILASETLYPGYLVGVPCGFFGEGEAGKSIFMMQEAAKIASERKQNVLLIGTEGGEGIFSDLWFPVFNKRFGSSTTCHTINASTIEELMKQFGKKVEIRISESGKSDIRYLGKSINFVEEQVKKDNVGIVILDSFTNPFRTEFAGGQLNFAGRADAECLILKELHRLSSLGLMVFVSHHATMNPTDPYRKPTVTGGKNIIHNFKQILYMEKTGHVSKEKLSYRRLWLERFFNLASWKKSLLINLTDTGFMPVIEATTIT